MPFAEAQARVRRARPDARLGPAVGAGGRDDRRDRRHRRLAARCATATAACATSSSGSPSCSRDGTIAKAGGKVIKNVAGYDLAKLFAGSFGTLGLIATVAVRLHPLPASTATARRRASTTRTALLRAVLDARAPPARGRRLDVAWRGRRGRLARALRRRRGRRAGARGRAARRARRRGRPRTTTSCGRPAGAASASERRRAEGLRPPDRPAGRDPRGAAAPPSSRAPRSGSRGSPSRPAAISPTAVAAARQALAPRACTVLDGAERVADQWPDAGPARRS